MAAWQMSSLLGAISLLKFEALHAANTGDVLRAISAIEALLALSRTMAEEPYLEAQHNRVQFVAAATRALEYVLNQKALAAEDLLRIARAFHRAERETGSALSRSFIGERCLGIHELGLINATPWSGPPPNNGQRLVLALVAYVEDATGIRDKRILERINAIQPFIEHAQELSRTNQATLLACLPLATNIVSATHLPGDILDASWRKALLEQLVCQARIQTVLAALRTEHFRVTHDGRLPESLNAIASGTWSLHEDLFATDHLTYAVLEKGYVIGSTLADRAPEITDLAPPNARAAGGDLTFTVRR
jgi:hypothetical protein